MAYYGQGTAAEQQDDDLYSGYNTQANAMPAQGMGYGTVADNASVAGSAFGPPSTAFRSPEVGAHRQGMPPGSALRTAGPPGTGMRLGTGRLGTASGVGEDGRPMTSNKGAGFSSAPRNVFDPFRQPPTAGSPGKVFNPAETSPEDQARDMEKAVHELLEESAKEAQVGDSVAALERAKEAGKKERQLCKLREQQGMADQVNVDLTFAVVFNLAHTYALNEMYVEALNAYTSVVKNKNFPQSGRMRVNMGNIYFQQRKYPMAIKMYRMALDQIPPTSREVRYKIMKNIGLAFIRMGQYTDASQTLENIMDNAADPQTGFNLMICFHALGDKEKMRWAFTKLLECIPSREEEEEEEDAEDADGTFRHDGLREELRHRQNETHRVILSAARLIAPHIAAPDSMEGFDWCVSQLNALGQTPLANEVEQAKAGMYLTRKDFKSAIGIFKNFEKKEMKLKARASTNLAFLYYLENDMENAQKYAQLAVDTDRYNARAWVNKGNLALSRSQLDKARSDYFEALAAEADCTEAIYNAGLVHKKMALEEETPEARSNYLDEAMQTFKKLYARVPDNLEVIHQIASIYELKQDFKNAVKWFEVLHSLVPNDPGVSAKLGAIYQATDDEARALHYYQESHRVFPANMDVISWLGAFHVRNEVYEKAVPLFDLASKLQPKEVKWELMVASCYRRVQAYPQALAKYKSIHSRHPDNVECLRYLVHICTELGQRDEVTEFAARLRRAERTQAPSTTGVYHGAPGEAGGMAAGRMPSAGVELGSNQDMGFATGGGFGGRKVAIKQGKHDDDDWGDGELGEDLLPM